MSTINNKTLLTQAGFLELDSQLAIFRQKRDHLITQIEEVALPDENGEDGLATQLKEELEVVNEKITHLEEALVNAEIVTENKNGIIQVGSRVKVAIANGSEKEFNIVSHLESDPAANKISDRSPLGQALMGKKVNDQFNVEAPVGSITYKITAVL
jgi:transcription elongation factor GreA